MIKYPNGKTCVTALPSSLPEKKYTGGRGMELEKEINLTNSFYLSNDIAVIHKKPTPVTVVKVDYPRRSSAKITEAYFKLPSTTDYNGIYKGKYIDFEAKETKNKTSFSLRNIHPHQIQHLKNIYRHGGIAFLIIRFTTLNETYLLMATKLTEFIENSTRESIPIAYLRENAYLIKDGYAPSIDYLKIVDKIIGGI